MTENAVKWTSGPWEFKTDPRSGDNGIRASGTGIFAEAFADIRFAGERASAEALANARLISASPDMAEALTPLRDLAAAYFRDGRRDDVPDSTAVWGFNDVTLTAGDMRKAVAALRKAGAL